MIYSNCLKRGQLIFTKLSHQLRQFVLHWFCEKNVLISIVSFCFKVKVSEGLKGKDLDVVRRNRLQFISSQRQQCLGSLRAIKIKSGFCTWLHLHICQIQIAQLDKCSLECLSTCKISTNSWLFCCVHRVGTSSLSSKLQPTRCNVPWIYLFLQTLYVFQAVPPPIIRST